MPRLCTKTDDDIEDMRTYDVNNNNNIIIIIATAYVVAT